MEKSPRRTELYYRVIDAFRAKILDYISPDDPEYEDVVALCEACFLAIVDRQSVRPEEMIRLISTWPHGYCYWHGDASAAMQNADLSFLEDPDVWKAELRAAYNMAWAWVWYIQEEQEKSRAVRIEDQIGNDSERKSSNE